MKKKVLIGISIVATLVLWQLISGRVIWTPTVSISELRYNSKENCGKAAKVKGKVMQHINDDGYEIGQGGATLRVAISKSNGKPRGPLPEIGKNIDAKVILACSELSVLVIGSSFSELP